MIELLTACAALILAAAALWRSYVPPRQRDVIELRERVGDCEYGLTELSARVAKRTRTEDMAKARTAHEERSKRRDAIESEALAILEANRLQAPTVTPAQRKAELRAQLAHARSNGGQPS